VDFECEQRPRACIGYREREPGRLQLRVELFAGEGVCDIDFEETQDSIAVELFVCGDVTDRNVICDCPVHIYLDQLLNGRSVIDVLSGQTVEERRIVPARGLDAPSGPDARAWGNV